MRKFLKIFTSRITISLVLILLQVLLVYVIVAWLQNNALFYLVFSALALLEVFALIRRDTLPETKLVWIIPIFALPVFGIVLYWLFNRRRLPKKLRKRLRNVRVQNIKQSTKASEDLPDEFAKNLSTYISNTSSFEMQYANSIKYFPSGEEYFANIIEKLKTAKKYIFLEFYIIKESSLWNEIFAVLKEKKESGVDVKIIVDDFGTMYNAKRKFKKQIKEAKIDFHIFNKVRPFVDSSFNNRTHRKIVVIDGEIAFSGGCNVADEYINKKQKYGLWKDTGFMVTGQASKNFVLSFLHLYSLTTDTKIDFAQFIKPDALQKTSQKFVQFFYDAPGDKKNVFQQSYIKLISNAKKYVYINTPYLVIDNQMEQTLIAAAQSGVDVKITLPGIADKNYVYELALDTADRLVLGGVKIFQFVPGFVHAKSFVSDDCYSIIGTSNLDYRSLFHNFECGAFVFDKTFALELKKDFQKTLESCKIYQSDKLSFFKKIKRAVLYLFAPLL